MADAKSEIPVSFLRACLAYDPETGRFTWLSRPLDHFADPRVFVRWNRYRSGTEAFTPTEGRRYLRATVTYQGVEVQLTAHRAAWALMTGEWPADQVDHIDCDTWNTRFANLREATQSQNNMNRGANREKISPLKGVSPCRGRRQWRSSIQIDGRVKYLGRFHTEVEAHQAYVAAATQIFGDFARAA